MNERCMSLIILVLQHLTFSCTIALSESDVVQAILFQDILQVNEIFSWSTKCISLFLQQPNDLPVGRSVDEVLRLVEAFKFTDEHGEVCPANWQAGAKTIKPDVKQSKEYFSTVN
ncbi:unnamed protein product [Mucor circinelloides]